MTEQVFPEKIEKILKKAGRDWTREEASLIQKLVKNGAREKLKARRKELRS